MAFFVGKLTVVRFMMSERDKSIDTPRKSVYLVSAYGKHAAFLSIISPRPT